MIIVSLQEKYLILISSAVFFTFPEFFPDILIIIIFPGVTFQARKVIFFNFQGSGFSRVCGDPVNAYTMPNLGLVASLDLET